MPQLALDFASAQRTLAGSKRYVQIALVLCGAFALGIVALKYEQQSEANASLRAQRDQQAARMQRRQPQEPLVPELSANLGQAVSVQAQLATAWDDLFHALELGRNDDIALLTLSADTARRELALGGEAKNFPALTQFSDTLQSNPLFQRVTLSNHRLSEGVSPVVVKFELLLVWREHGELHRGLP